MVAANPQEALGALRLGSGGTASLKVTEALLNGRKFDGLNGIDTQYNSLLSRIPSKAATLLLQFNVWNAYEK